MFEMKGVRILLNEEISKESAEKTVRIAVRVSQPSLKLFLRALKISVGKSSEALGEKLHPTKGKQSVKTLIRQGQGVSSIPLAEKGLKDFNKIAGKYGVDFAVVKDSKSEPAVYTIFFKAKDMDVITRILQDYSAKQVKQPDKKSVLAKLKKFQDIVAAIPKKVFEKKKERSL